VYHLSRVRDTITLADLTQAEKTCPAEFMKFRPLLPLAGMPQELQSGARSPNELTGIFATTHRANLRKRSGWDKFPYCSILLVWDVDNMHCPRGRNPGADKKSWALASFSRSYDAVLYPASCLKKGDGMTHKATKLNIWYNGDRRGSIFHIYKI
jgi:hypothetical protein